MKEEIIDIEFNNQKKDYSFEIMSLQNLFQRNLNQLLSEPHRLGFYIILIIENGKGTHTIDFNEYEYSNGTVFTIGKNQVQKYTINENLKAYQILFTQDFIIKYYDEKQVFNSQLIFNDAIYSPKFQLTESQITEIIDIAQNLDFEYHDTLDDEYKSPIIRSGLHVLLMKLERFKQQQVPLKMDANYTDFFRFKNLVDEKCFKTRNVSDYCNELNINQKRLNLLTKSILNKTAKEFIDDRTVLEIKRLLSNTNSPIKEIAYKAGFDEPTNLVKYFKNITKQSPTDFRASLK